MIVINLNFINQSNDANNSQVIIFQKNASGPPVNDSVVAWKVITNCNPGWNHPFKFTAQIYVAAGDDWGNFSPQLPANNGDTFSVVNQTSGGALTYSGQGADTQGIEVLNGVSSGTINANIFRDGRLLATKTNLVPGEKALFRFTPTIWISAVSQIEEGRVINPAILPQLITEISLIGIKSADIVMTGGGPGIESTPFVFLLENVVYA